MKYNLSQKRKQKGYTQEYLSNKLDMSRKTLHKIEKQDNSVSLYYYKKYLEALDLELHIRPKNGETSDVENFVYEVLDRIGYTNPIPHRYGWVYIMTHKDIIKIGVTQLDDPSKRAQKIYQDTGRECIVYYAKLVSDVWKVEAQLHEAFKDTRLDGEWFSADKYIVKLFMERFE